MSRTEYRKPSPKPWKWDKAAYILDATKCPVAILTVPGLRKVAMADPLDRDPDSNARHIVHCVNVHDELLHALIQLREWQREPWGEDDSPANEAVVNQAEAAIAKATE